MTSIGIGFGVGLRRNRDGGREPVNPDPVLLLEDGEPVLFEDGGEVLLEMRTKMILMPYVKKKDKRVDPRIEANGVGTRTARSGRAKL